MKIIDLNIKIEYDPEKDEIVNYSTSLNGVSEKKKTTTPRSSSKKSQVTGLTVVREDNKLVLSSELVEKLNGTSDSRVSIEYKKIDDTLCPLILLNEDTGNKLTKSNTVQYRGKANETLAEWGTKFEAEFYKEGVYRLIGDNVAPIKTSSIEQTVKEVSLDIETTSDKTYTIEDLDFNL